MAPQYFDLRTQDWVEMLKAKLSEEGLTMEDLPDADEPDFLLVIEELGFNTALHRMKLRKAVRELQQGPEEDELSPTSGSRRRRQRSTSARSLSNSYDAMRCDLPPVREVTEDEYYRSGGSGVHHCEALREGSPLMEERSLPVVRSSDSFCGEAEAATADGLSATSSPTRLYRNSMSMLASSGSPTQSEAHSSVPNSVTDEPTTLPSTPRCRYNRFVDDSDTATIVQGKILVDAKIPIPICTTSTVAAAEVVCPLSFQEERGVSPRRTSLSPLRLGMPSEQEEFAHGPRGRQGSVRLSPEPQDRGLRSMRRPSFSPVRQVTVPVSSIVGSPIMQDRDWVVRRNSLSPVRVAKPNPQSSGPTPIARHPAELPGSPLLVAQGPGGGKPIVMLPTVMLPAGSVAGGQQPPPQQLQQQGSNAGGSPAVKCIPVRRVVCMARQGSVTTPPPATAVGASLSR